GGIKMTGARGFAVGAALAAATWLVSAVACGPAAAQDRQATVAPAATATPAAEAAPGKPAPARPHRGGRAHVYLLRGLMNIFSLGMDDLAAKIRSRGIDATVYNYTDSHALVAEITAKYKAGKHGPIILIGHSLGANAVMLMGQEFGKRGVPVALIVPF